MRYTRNSYLSGWNRLQQIGVLALTGEWQVPQQRPQVRLEHGCEVGYELPFDGDYAALVDYYTVQKLQQLTQGMACLYLLCFLLQRYSDKDGR
jgi:hypothetical protein